MPPRPAPYAARRPHFAYYLSCAVATVLCVVLLYLAAQEARGVMARCNEGVRLVGRVTGRRPVLSAATPPGKRAATPKPGAASLEYTVTATYQGRAVQVINQFRNAEVTYQLGDPVPVVYVPRQPEYSRFATTTEQYGQLLQLAGFGLLSGFAAALLWLRQLTAWALFRSRTTGA